MQQSYFCPRVGSSTVHVGVNATFLQPNRRPSTNNQPGTASCPWNLRTERGRKVEVSLLSFGAVSTGSGDDGGALQCRDFIVIVDGDVTVERPVCRNQRREKILLTSEGDSLQVFVRMSATGASQRDGRYLLQARGLLLHVKNRNKKHKFDSL